MIVNTINKDLVYVSDVCRVFFLLLKQQKMEKY